eukprot:TRINITY_DN11274_c0_g1_i1.p1 TRINITY_DN11274_c0_g1~~TRINITY_DN11274_c0_g1_i1.p1  ORF type:complete len:164 (-),score=15.27 TRINITY_DN11274_c0_g1_i1:838-1260(-)
MADGTLFANNDAYEVHDAVKPNLDVVTTLCVRDLPCSMSPKWMANELWMLGFGGRYDFLYLPCRSCGKKFLGYGFINFCTAEDARSFAKVFVDYRFEGWFSEKRAYTEPSRVQGFEANILQFASMDVAKRGQKQGPWISA